MKSFRLWLEGFLHGVAVFALLLALLIWQNWGQFRAACKFTM